MLQAELAYLEQSLNHAGLLLGRTAVCKQADLSSKNRLLCNWRLRAEGWQMDELMAISGTSRPEMVQHLEKYTRPISSRRTRRGTLTSSLLPVS